MSANHVFRRISVPPPPATHQPAVTNLAKARAAWGADLPAWVRLLAETCDRTSQRRAAEQLGKSSPYVSRLISRTYAGSYPEAERMVRATWGTDEVDCPLFGPLPLASCIRERRRKGPARDAMHLRFARTCPTCPHNGDAQ